MFWKGNSIHLQSILHAFLQVLVAVVVDLKHSVSVAQNDLYAKFYKGKYLQI
jgi:hypothetical protein